MTRLPLASALLALTLATPASALDRWRAQDGDSILSPQGERIRLLGVDTPERSCKCQQECSTTERAYALTRTKRRDAARTEMTCFPPDKYGRTLARVYLDGRDLSDMLIEAKLGRPLQRGTPANLVLVMGGRRVNAPAECAARADWSRCNRRSYFEAMARSDFVLQT